MSYPSREARGVPPWLSDVFRHTSPATVPQYTCFFRNFKCFFALFLDKSCTYCRLLAADRPDRPSPCAAFLYMKKSVISSAPFPPGAGKEREPKGSRSQRVKKASQSSRAAVGSYAAIRMRPAPCGYTARRRRKKCCSRRVPSSRRSRCGLRCKHAAGMFAYAAASENTLRGASVESFATRGPRRSPAKRVRWGEEAQRSERRLPLCGGRRDTELVPTTRRAQRITFGGKGVSLFRQFLTAAPPPGSSHRGGSAGWRRKFSF